MQIYKLNIFLFFKYIQLIKKKGKTSQQNLFPIQLKKNIENIIRISEKYEVRKKKYDMRKTEEIWIFFKFENIYSF